MAIAGDLDETRETEGPPRRGDVRGYKSEIGGERELLM